MIRVYICNKALAENKDPSLTDLLTVPKKKEAKAMESEQWKKAIALYLTLRKNTCASPGVKQKLYQDKDKFGTVQNFTRPKSVDIGISASVRTKAWLYKLSFEMIQDIKFASTQKSGGWYGDLVYCGTLKLRGKINITASLYILWREAMVNSLLGKNPILALVWFGPHCPN